MTEYIPYNVCPIMRYIFPLFQEIYPPKVSEFAYVTDGACSVSDILDMELLICKVGVERERHISDLVDYSWFWKLKE